MLEGSDAEATVAPAHEELHALARRVAERLERRAGQLRQGHRIEAGPDGEAPVGRAAHQAVHLERPGQPVRSGARQAAGGDQLGE